MSISRRSILGGLLGAPVALVVTKINAEAKAGPLLCPDDHNWIGQDPIKVWISATKAPIHFYSEVLHILGRFGIKKFQEHAHYRMADCAQTQMLRRLGDWMRAAPRNQERIDAFTEPDPIRLKEAHAWLFTQVQREWHTS